LELQAKFDDKLHKNDQQLDDIAVEYKAAFQDAMARDKNSLRDAVWDKEYRNFKDFCKIRVSFRAGLTSGLCTDQQELVLASKQGSSHDLFLLFKVD
jgi:hypothetical protein